MTANIYIDESSKLKKSSETFKYLMTNEEKLAKRKRYGKEFPLEQLQWPRDRDIVLAPVKIVTPYKSTYNNFALDTNPTVTDTDVNYITFRHSVPMSSYYVLLAILNAKITERHFKSFAKLASGETYDYYANSLKKIRIPASIDWSKEVKFKKSAELKDYHGKSMEYLALAGYKISNGLLTEMKEEKKESFFSELDDAIVNLDESPQVSEAS